MFLSQDSDLSLQCHECHLSCLFALLQFHPEWLDLGLLDLYDFLFFRLVCSESLGQLVFFVLYLCLEREFKFKLTFLCLGFELLLYLLTKLLIFSHDFFSFNSGCFCFLLQFLRDQFFSCKLFSKFEYFAWKFRFLIAMFLFFKVKCGLKCNDLRLNRIAIALLVM